MSEQKPTTSGNARKIIVMPTKVKSRTGVVTPICIKRDSLKIVDDSRTDLLSRLNLNSNTRGLFREELLYTSSTGDFLGNTHSVKLKNRVNLFTNSNKVIAKYFTHKDNLYFEKTSDSVTKVIGQKNFDIVYSTLKAVNDTELRIKAILALLSIAKKSSDAACQTEETISVKADEEKSVTVKEERSITVDVKRLVKFENKSVQTEQSSIDYMFRPQYKKQTRRKFITPYVVKDKNDLPYKVKDKKKLIMHLDKSMEKNSENDLKNGSNIKEEPQLEELKDLRNDMTDILHDDKSNDSDGSIGSIGNLSTASRANQLLDIISHQTENSKPLYENPAKDPLNVEYEALNLASTESVKMVKSTMIKMMDGTHIFVPVEPKDHFHIAVPDILNNVTKEEKVKLIRYQTLIDWMFCDVRDEGGYLPIHTAVVNEDVNLLKRQCYILKKKGLSIDERAWNMTPLQLSLFCESSGCLSVLLSNGADPFCEDEEDRAPIHLAAETAKPHLAVLLSYFRENARQILEEHEEFWKPSLNGKPNEELVQHLIDQVCNSMDRQGCTPLMLASKAGLPDNVRLLAEASPLTVCKKMASCGNTALFLAVAEACLDAASRGNKQRIAPNYSATIQILLDYGADVTTENYAGTSINDLLQEFPVHEIAKLLSCSGKAKSINKNYNDSADIDNLMIIKKEEDLSSDEETKIKTETVNKPVIIENIPLTSACINIKSKGKCLKPISPKDKITKGTRKRAIDSCHFDSNVDVSSVASSKKASKIIVNKDVGNMAVICKANSSKNSDGQCIYVNAAPMVSTSGSSVAEGKKVILDPGISDKNVATNVVTKNVTNVTFIWKP